MRVLSVVFALVVLSFCLSMVPDASASTYLGDVCFQFNHTEGSMAGQSGTAKFRVFDTGAGTYSLIFNPPTGLVKGTFVLSGNELRGSFTDTGWYGDDGAYSVTSYAVMNLDTLTGTYRGLDHEAELNSSGKISYYSGTAAFVECP